MHSNGSRAFYCLMGMYCFVKDTVETELLCLYKLSLSAGVFTLL